MKLKVCLFGIIFLVGLCSKSVWCQNFPFYSIAGSDSIRQGERYRFSTFSGNLPESLHVNYSIVGRISDGSTVSLYKPHFFIESNNIQSFEFDTSYLPLGEYEFLADIYNPVSQEVTAEQWPLNFLEKQFHIIIQTDKEIYKAEDLIRYRIFAFDADTKPVNIGDDVVVLVVDPNGFRMREITRPAFTKGRYNDEYQLSNFFVQGLWTIRAQIGDQVFEKKVTAETYELPLFYAELDVPKEVGIIEERFPVRVTIQYTHGITMNGIAVVKFLRYSSVETFRKTLIIGSDSDTFTVDIYNDLGIKKDEEVIVVLEFTDTMADRTITVTSAMQFRAVIAVLGIEASDSFRRNENFEFALTSRNYDGSPAAEDIFVTVEILRQRNCQMDEVTLEWSCEDDVFFQDFVTDATGVAHGFVDAGDYDYISLQAYCKKCVNADHMAELHEPIFEVRVIENNARVDHSLTIEVETVFDITSGFCYMMAKNVHKNLIQLEFSSGVARFGFTPDASYAPVTQVECVAIDIYGHQHNSETLINFKELPNKVSIELLTDVVKPGQNASLRISGTVGTVVSLVAIDKRLVRLQKSKGLGEATSMISNQISQFSKEQVLSSRNFDILRILEYVETTTGETLGTAPTGVERMSPMKKSHPGMKQSKKRKSLNENIPEDDGNYVRSNFQEVFLWEDIDIETSSMEDPSQGSEVIEFRVPDSIAAYSFTAFGFGPSGAGVIDDPPVITVRTDFFVEMVVPYSIKQSETYVLTIRLTNRMEALDVLCTVTRNDKFEIGYPLSGWHIGTTHYSKEISAEENTVTTFKIGIHPLRSGVIPLLVHCGRGAINDTLLDELNVVPDGIERIISQSLLILKQSGSNADVDFTCEIPAGVDPNTVSTQISFTGDLQGDILTNLGNLLRQPSGCGEQNLANFANTIFLHAYLRETDQLTDEISARIQGYVRNGFAEGEYQRHMQLRLPDGSYRYFSGRNPSTFLTAFSIKVFQEAKTFMTIDQYLIDTALTWLLTKQEPDGSFYEDLDALYGQHHGGLKDRTALAAYISIILSQIYEATNNQNLVTPINNVINYLIRSHNEDNLYQLAMVCYALYCVDHAIFNAKYETFVSRATVHDDMMYWETSSRGLNVEAAANALLFISKLDYLKSVKIATYLISMKNQGTGAWTTTTDTVAAIESLTAAQDLQNNYYEGLELIAAPSPNGAPFPVQITQEDPLQLHTFALDPQTRRVTVLARGDSAGKATATFTCRYFERFEEFVPRFHVEHAFLNDCITPLKMRVCVNFIRQQNDDLSNMVIVKISMPSGFIFDHATPMSDVVQLRETENLDTKVVVYLNSVGQENVCFEIYMMLGFPVNNLDSSLIEVLDYYSPEKRAEYFYEVTTSGNRC